MFKEYCLIKNYKTDLASALVLCNVDVDVDLIFNICSYTHIIIYTSICYVATYIMICTEIVMRIVLLSLAIIVDPIDTPLLLYSYKEGYPN